MRANVFRFDPESGHCGILSACPLCAPLADVRRDSVSRSIRARFSAQRHRAAKAARRYAGDVPFAPEGTGVQVLSLSAAEKLLVLEINEFPETAPVALPGA
jgi:hypothetical protein